MAIKYPDFPEIDTRIYRKATECMDEINMAGVDLQIMVHAGPEDSIVAASQRYEQDPLANLLLHIGAESQDHSVRVSIQIELVGLGILNHPAGEGDGPGRMFKIIRLHIQTRGLVFIYDFTGRPVAPDFSAINPQGPFTKPAHMIHLMADENDGPPTLRDFLH